MAVEDTKKTKTSREIESISERIKASQFNIKDAIIPLSVGVILILLGFFLFVPMVQTALSQREEYQEVRDKEEKLQELENKLKAMDEGTLQVDLINSKKVIPQNLTVASFISYIDTLAREKELQSKSLSAADTQSSTTRVDQGDSEDSRRIYYGVRSQLAYEGSLENVSEFLEDLHLASPYIISARGVLLKGSPTGWTVQVGVIGYYVPESTLKMDLYSPFESYTEYQDIIDIFTEKAEELN